MVFGCECSGARAGFAFSCTWSVATSRLSGIPTFSHSRILTFPHSHILTWSAATSRLSGTSTLQWCSGADACFYLSGVQPNIRAILQSQKSVIQTIVARCLCVHMRMCSCIRVFGLICGLCLRPQSVKSINPLIRDPDN